MFDLADRAIRDVAVLGRLGPNGSVGGLALSADESSILYDSRSRFEVDLMMIEPFQ
jgi:hypothetical protein